MEPSKHSVVIVGTGFAGLCMAIRLREAGIEDFVILERAPGVGGTWRENTYPGAACDVPSHLYSFSFEPYPSWSRSFGEQREILQYLEHCTDKYGLRSKIRFDTSVTSARFDERAGEWEVKTSRDDTLRCRVLVSGSGGLNRPSVPELPGISAFQGKTFHTACWDHSFVFEGKRVALVGTGASGIQVVPELAPKVKHLSVFQRTPPWILPKPDRAISPLERALYRRVPAAQQLARALIYAQLESRAVGFLVDTRVMKLAQKLALSYLAERVRDPVLREKLTPHYLMGCKRVLMSNDYFETLQRENVSLVTEGIERVDARGIVTSDGRVHPLDAIVYATGFQAADAVAPFSITGRNGLDLNQAWRDGAEAYLGTTVSGFPNLFLIIGPNTGLGHNSMVFMIESQVAYILDAIKTMRERNLKLVDVRREALRSYNDELQTRMRTTVWSTGGCSSWYQNKHGKNTTLWPGFTFQFRMRTRRFDVASYELVADDSAQAQPAASSRVAVA